MLRIEQISATDSRLDYQYEYDNLSNILTKTTEHGEYSYIYDDVSRLTNAANPTQPPEAYTYDGVGNRLASVVTSPIVHNANNELLAYGEMEYTYDANGNMIQKRIGTVAVNYVYDAANRLVKVEDDLTKTVIAEYSYDPFGRRLWKEVSGVRTYFFYADEGLVAEYDGQGTEIRSYGYQPDSTWTTDPLWLKQGGQYYWYQNDHLGTPQKLIERNGTVVWEAQYEAFGKTQILINTIENNLRFPGQYFDAETGLHYNYHRYYDPKVGRYLKLDPSHMLHPEIENIPFLLFNHLATPQESHLYSYATNNPITGDDERGLYTIDSSCQQYESKIVLAIIFVRMKLYSDANTNCVRGGRLRTCLANKLLTLKIKCEAIYPCGRAKVPSDTIILSTATGFLPVLCGPLHSIILHKMVHSCYNRKDSANYLEEKVPEACEFSCFGVKGRRDTPNPCDCK